MKLAIWTSQLTALEIWKICAGDYIIRLLFNIFTFGRKGIERECHRDGFETFFYEQGRATVLAARQGPPSLILCHRLFCQSTHDRLQKSKQSTTNMVMSLESCKTLKPLTFVQSLSCFVGREHPTCLSSRAALVSSFIAAALRPAAGIRISCTRSKT